MKNKKALEKLQMIWDKVLELDYEQNNNKRADYSEMEIQKFQIKTRNGIKTVKAELPKLVDVDPWKSKKEDVMRYSPAKVDALVDLVDSESLVGGNSTDLPYPQFIEVNPQKVADWVYRNRGCRPPSKKTKREVPNEKSYTSEDYMRNPFSIPEDAIIRAIDTDKGWYK